MIHDHSILFIVSENKAIILYIKIWDILVIVQIIMKMLRFHHCHGEDDD